MLAYYSGLALRSLCLNAVLTALMIAAIGVGIGTSMTVLAVFRAMSADPVEEKSSQLYAPQIDSWGPDNKQPSSSTRYDGLQDQLAYTDALALMRAHAARRQTAMYSTSLSLTPADPQLRALIVNVRATYGDFFPMFNVPFQYGEPWNPADDDGHAAVVIITRTLNDMLFGGGNSVGKTVTLNNEEYRVAGVLGDWRPVPRFYDLNGDSYGEPEQVFLPFTHAVDRKMAVGGNVNCKQAGNAGWESFLQSDCVWIQFWVELPTLADARKYRMFLGNYASEQRRSGRFHWLARTELRDVRQWLNYERVVSDEVRVMIIVSFSFLFVCILNTMGLMLAKTLGRATDIAMRRALGASHAAIFAQCLIEAGVVGLLGGLLGLVLTALGLAGARRLFSAQILDLVHLDVANICIALLLAIAATIAAGLYPTWRASRVHPALQLKTQ